MRRVVGLARDELETRERVFDGLTMNAVRRSVRALTSDVGTLTAAATPQLSATPGQPNPTIPAGALGVVTTTWAREVDETLFPFLVQTFVDAAAELRGELPAGAPKITYDLAATYLRSASNRLRGIGDVVWNEMRTQLALGYESGESIHRLAARLRTVAQISEPRALTIARTEVIPAANFGSLQQMRAAGFTDEECRKEWLATNDARTRPAHREADGQLVGLSQPFVVDGDRLQVPGDPAGRAENVINCRCSVAYVFDEDEDDEPLVADAAFEAEHPRDERGRFGDKSPFTILPKSRRGKSGDRMYAPGMWGRYGGAGIMMRHVGADGVARYMVVQRANPGYNKWRWQLPGGARDQLETASQAAAREANEEIGVTPAQLETLTPRGAHVVELPVEGKEPWTYSSVVADAPEAFRPKIDYGELGAARWLTYDQLVEMRGRGRLIAPFAAQLEDIIAKFDEPLVAGFYVINMTTSDDLPGYYDLMTASKWTAADAAKHPRDAEGQFTEKAGVAMKHTDLMASISAAPPGVVAVGMGPLSNRRVVKTYQGFYRIEKKSGGKWISHVGILNEKLLSERLAKGTWTQPASAAVTSIFPPNKVLDPGMTTPQAKKAAQATITQHVPLHINTAVVYKKGGYADGEVIAETKLPNGSPGRLIWDAKQKKFVVQARVGEKWVDIAAYTKKAAYDKFSKETGWTKPSAAVPVVAIPPLAPKKAAAPKLKDLAAQHVGAPIVVKEMKEVKPLGKPIHLNTTAIYKTKYADGAVVAEKQGANLPERLMWDAKKKKFIHQEQTPQGAWLKAGEYNKGQAYQKFSKQTGWTQPTASSAGPATPATFAPPKAVADLDDFLASTGAEGADWVKSVTSADLAKYDAEQLDAAESKVVDLLNAGHLTYPEALVFDKLKAQAALPSIVQVPDFMSDPPHVIAGFFANLTQDDFDNLSVSDQISIQNEAPFYDAMASPGGKTYSEKIKDFVAGKGDADAEALPDFDTMSFDQAVVWFTDMTQNEYNALSKADRQKLFNDATKLSGKFSGTGFFADTLTDLVKGFVDNQGTIDAVSFDDFDDASGPSGMSPVHYNGMVIAWAKSADDGSGAFLYQAATDGSKGLYVGTVSFEDGETVPEVVAGLLDEKILKPSEAWLAAPAATLLPKTSSGLDVDEFLAHDELAQVAIINSMTSADVDALTPIEYSDVAAQAAVLKNVGFLSPAEFDAFQVKGTIMAPMAAPATPPTLTFAPNASSYHVDVHSKIKPVGSIGVPSTNANLKYVVASPATAGELQKQALAAFGKSWTSMQVSAIKKYGTSVGYRSMNAVLRDDAKQLKLFSDAQLKDGVKHAVNLQNAMTPLTENLRLFRGTGAHAFGQNSIAANFDELKKLEGQTLTDKGFLSTTVDEKKAVSYDYAKKPIQMVIDTPAGTPAVYADAAIPGHSEHEIILGAGTSYRVDAVRKATAEDKARYGGHVEHVVVTTVVPSTSNASTPLSAPAAKPASAVAPTGLTPVAPSAATKPTLGPIQASDLQLPIKITTTLIYKQKYQHGAVVAYRKNVTGLLSRLVWSATTKKFIMQNQDPDADSGWVNFAGYGKGEAYQTFGKNVFAPWYAPPPGDSAIGTGGVFGTTSVAPKVSTTASAPATSTIAAPPKPVKQEKFDAAELQKLHGQIPGFGPTYRRELFDKFKKSSSVGFVTLSTSESDVFTALHETLEKHNGDPSAIPLNLLQLVKLVDEESTNKANAIAKSKGEAGDLVNAQLYEKKLVAWLQTPSGASFATNLVHPPAPTTINGFTYKSANLTQPVLNTLAKIKPASSIGVPDPNAKTFNVLTPSAARQLQNQMLTGDPWTGAQSAALKKYSTQYYTEMNPVIRDLTHTIKYKPESDLLLAARTAVNIQAGMRPLAQSVRVYRRTDTFTDLSSMPGFADIKKFEGKLFVDRAPFSTSVVEGTWSGKLHMTIDVPAGTPAAYIESISANQSEYEMLLALGLKYRVVSVTQGTGSIVKIHMRVEA